MTRSGNGFGRNDQCVGAKQAVTVDFVSQILKYSSCLEELYIEVLYLCCLLLQSTSYQTKHIISIQ